MGTTELSRGQNVALPEGAEQLRVSVGWTTGSAADDGPLTPDLIALLTDGDRRARSEDDSDWRPSSGPTVRAAGK